MSSRFLRLTTGMLVFAAIVLMASRSWAIRNGLGPSKDEWGLKYDVAINDADNDKVNVEFTVTSEGRLKPIYSAELVAFSKQTDAQGGRSYDVLVPIELKKNSDGQLTGQAQMRKDAVDRAHIRIISLTLDGQRQPSGGVFYNIPLNKFTKKAPLAANAP